MLDYSIKSAEERSKLVEKIISQTPPEKLTQKQLNILSDYIIQAMTKEEKKEKRILTNNRLVTINKREISYEGLSSKLENGEDGVYNMMAADDKSILFTPKISITEKDIKDIPPLKTLIDAIKSVEEMEKKATGKNKYLLKKQLIQMRRDQYTIKTAYKKPIYSTTTIKSNLKTDFNEHITIDENGAVSSDGMPSFFNPKHISILLQNYSLLKENSEDKIINDLFCIIDELDNLIKTALVDYPIYQDLIQLKISGRQNLEIQQILKDKYNISYTIEWLSCLWRNKIPKLIAEKAQEEYLIWYYTNKEKGKWKRCSCCGEIKLAHSFFFSKNSGSKDGFYSICKKCRNKKKK